MKEEARQSCVRNKLVINVKDDMGIQELLFSVLIDAEG
jgi:hypothetical protein